MRVKRRTDMGFEMKRTSKTSENYCEPEIYEIRLQGHLHDRWAIKFECMTLTRESDGTTKLYGQLPDQTALHGILEQIRNMNLKLISVKQVEPTVEGKDSDEQPLSIG